MRVVVVVVLAVTSGCAALAGANAHHNSRGSACIDTPAFAIIDLAIGFGATALVAASEESAGYYAIPGVFFASGVIGGVSAISCRERQRIPDDRVAPASNSAPAFGEAEVDPAAIDPLTTAEPILEPEPAPPSPLHPVLNMRLPADFAVPPEPQSDEKIACRDAPGACPPSHTCAIAGADAGYCVPR